MDLNDSTKRDYYAIPYSAIPRKRRREAAKNWELHYAMKEALRVLWIERKYSSEEQKEVAFEWARGVLPEILERLRERTELMSGKPLD